MKKIIIVFISIMSVSNVILANRIAGRADPAARCLENVPKEKCLKLNEMALKQSCITQEEYNSLQGFGSYASCSPNPDDMSKWELRAWCACGCFEQNTRIAAASNENLSTVVEVRAIDLLSHIKDYNLMNLAVGSTINAPNYNASPIRIGTTGPEKKPLIVFSTEDGRVLKVTERHAVLKSEGMMVPAVDFKVGDQLVLHNGESVKISKIERSLTPYNVINFAVETQDPIEHVIVAEGLLVGDLLWQSALEDLQNQMLIRK